MKRRDLLRMIPGLALLPFLRQRPINWHPQILYYWSGQTMTAEEAARRVRIMAIAADREAKLTTGRFEVRKPPRWDEDRPALSIDRTLEIFKQRIIDEQRQLNGLLKDLKSVL